jgi:hypothetical protein
MARPRDGSERGTMHNPTPYVCKLVVERVSGAA